MAPMTAAAAIYARLSGDDDLRAALVALMPSGQPGSETDLLRRFSLAPGPQLKPTYPLVLWRLTGTPDAERTRCGGIDSTEFRFRVWVENPGRNMAALQPVAERIGELLAGYTSGSVVTMLDLPWMETQTGAAGDYVESGWDVLVRVTA